MSHITADTSLEEIATRVSEALAAAGISAVLGGGGAVALYSDNRYMSKDLDFITVERNKVIAPIVAELGFRPQGKDFVHRETPYVLEFPPGPVAFGHRYIDDSETTTVNTRFGELRVITPTQCVMDRLAWFVHGNDRQALAQAVLVAERQEIDWGSLRDWARSEEVDAGLIDAIRAEAQRA